MTGFKKQAQIFEWTPRLLCQTAKLGSAGMLNAGRRGQRCSYGGTCWIWTLAEAFVKLPPQADEL